MKKILFAIITLLLSVSVNAQYFTLTETGLKPTNNQKDNFLVIEKKGKSQADLFKQVKDYITASYVSPKDVMSENGTDMITLNGISQKDVQCKKGFAMLPFETNYTIVFMFKDGKIRINNPSINSMFATSTTLGGDISSYYQLVLTDEDPVQAGRERIVVFKGKGKTTKGAKESIESFFNYLIENIINYDTQSEDW